MIGGDLKLWQKAAILVVAPLILEIVLFGAVRNAERQLERAHQAERESTKQLFDISRGLKAALLCISDVFNYRTSGKEHSLVRCKRDLRQIREIRKEFNDTMVNFKNSALDATMQDTESLLNSAITLSPADGDQYDFKSLPVITKMASHSLNAFSLTRSEFEHYHDLKIDAVRDRQRELDRLVASGIFISAFFALLIGFLFHRGTASQINTLMDNISRLGRREKLLPALLGKSELAQLDRVFHTMAESIESLTERERAVFANATELILIISEDMKIELASHSCENFLGRPADDIVGMRLSEISASLIRELGAVQDRASGEGRFEISFTNSLTEKLIDLEVSATWSQADRNFYCVAHDIAARKELERIKQSFIAMVSHDLRSPISASQAALQVLKSDPECCRLSPEGMALVDRMLAGNTRLLGLINDLLDMEKLEYGLITLDYELVTFNDLVYECLASLQTLAKSKGVEIVSDDSDQFIYCDSARIVQVLVNIAGNAIKISNPGQSVELRFKESGGLSRIAVIDHGPGIAEEFMPHLFDRYSQSTDNRGLMKQGSGLGLAVAKELVELHGGNITVNSVPGAGATFVVLLPLKSSSKSSQKI